MTDAMLFDERDASTPPTHDLDEPVYVISVAAELVGVHAQTLRHYEREGLVIPRRSAGGIRLYSARDVMRMRMVNQLTNTLGMNLAGVALVLKMRREIEQLHTDVEQLKADVRQLKGFVLEDSHQS